MADFDICGQTNDSKTVRLKFLRSELLYDIKNYAFVEADVMGEERQHGQHVLAEIGEEGNVDRVNRILAVVHAAAIEMLYPYTKVEPQEEEIDDIMITPESYDIEMQVPLSMSRNSLLLLSRLIHEYMVYRVLADWLSITNPEAAANWMMKAEATETEIGRAKNRRGVMTRKSHPW
jgi:hypothetical protein